MRVKAISGGYDFIPENKDDHNSLLMLCRGCSRLYQWGPHTRYCRKVRRRQKAPPGHLVCGMMDGCPGCEPGTPLFPGAVRLGRVRPGVRAG